MYIILNKSSHLIKKEYNLGVEILRVFLSFSVVMDHLYNKNILRKYSKILYYHIPTFFLISFYFTFNTFSSFNIKKIKLRFERLIIPYIGWSIIAFLLKNIYFYLLKINVEHSLKSFIKHLITGHILNLPLWYQAILLFTTITFLIIIFICKNNNLFVFQIFALISYILQYSELNYYLIKKYLSFHAELSFGRFIEAIPNAVTGYTFAYFKLIEKLKEWRLKAIFLNLSILIIINKYSIIQNFKNFKYGGLRLNIGASCIFLSFSLIPIENLLNTISIKILKQITRYTGGIYYMHYLVGNFYLLKRYFNTLNGTILGCLIIYLICYILCSFGIKLFGKNRLKYMFI